MRACDKRFVALLSKLPARLVDTIADRWGAALEQIPRTTYERGEEGCAVGGSETIGAIALLLATLPADRLRPFLDGLGDAILGDRLPRPPGTGTGRIWIEEQAKETTAPRGQRRA